MKTNFLHAGQRGFTLLEALIALVVMAFGMLALAGMQITLSRSGDVAKQRTEATRLAQRQIDQLRAYTSIAAAASHPIVWDGLAGSTTTATTNANYTITTAFGSTASAPMRPFSVTVTWNDRAGELQAVTLASVISKTDPEKIGLIANPLPLNQPLKRPKNRNINIPIPAKDLGGGYSSTQFNSRYLIVYSNTSGGVVEVCDPNKADVSVDEINALRKTSHCDTITGYIVAGYVGRTASTVPWPTGISTASIVRDTAVASKGIQCLFEDARDQNTGTVISGYKYYICVVPLNAPYLYDGTLRLAGLSKLASVIACRYQYTQSDLDNNEKNIQPYTDVNKSIDEQNYLLTNSASGVCPSSMTVSGVSTGVLHQDCRATSVSLHATHCP
jgi:type IV pilus modification protein PilV